MNPVIKLQIYACPHVHFALRRESAADSAGEKERLNDWKDILSTYPWQKVKKAPADSTPKVDI